MKKLFTLLAAAALSVSAFAQLGQDVTADYVTDPDMNDVANWTNNGFKNNQKGTPYSLFTNYFIEQWSASTSTSEATLGDISIEQTIEHLPNGTYLFSAAVIACQQSGLAESITGVTLFAGDTEVACSTGDGQPELFYALTKVSNSSLTVGLRVAGTNANWVAWDNAKLYYYGEGVDVDPEEAVAVLQAYADLPDAIAAAQAVFDEYQEEESVVATLSKLAEAIEAATAMNEQKTADSKTVNAAIAAMQEYAATIQVSVQIYGCLDELDQILNNCVAGTKYGTYPQSQMDRIADMQEQLSDMLDGYEAGTMAASDILPYLNTVRDAIVKFYASMITIDFSLPLNSSMWPYDPDDEVAAAQHEILFKGYEGPWTFGVRIHAADSLRTWNVDDNLLGVPATSKAAADVLGWADNATDAWLFIQADGYFHPLLDKIPCAIFTAPEDAIYFLRCQVSSQDDARVSKNRGAMHAYAYYLSAGSNVMNQIGEKVEFNNNTDPANFHFCANLKAGDRIAFSLNDCNISGSNGNAYSRVDTLYALGSKNDDGGYSLADAQESGLLFYNPYVAADNWEGLVAAIAEAQQVLADNADNVGDAFAQYPAEAVAVLDSIAHLGSKMYEIQIASQPDVDAMVSKIKAAITTFYGSAVSGLCIPTQEAPNDSTLYANCQYFADGLYYLRDRATGLYVTAPNSEKDKATIYAEELIDETFTQQNAQVWHFAANDTLCCYAIASHANDGTTWTLEDEAAVGIDNSGFYGYYHISDSPNGRFGTALYPVSNETDMYWRTFRIRTNGQGYSLTAGKSMETGWVQVVKLSSSNSLMGVNGGQPDYCWEIIPFTAPDRIDSPAADAAVVAVRFFSPQGVRSDSLVPGVNIIQTVRADGTVTVTKRFVR